MLTNKQRDALRRRQDHLVALARRHGISDDTRISSRTGVTMTVADVRQYLFPSFAADIDAAITEMERWDRT